MGYKLDYVYSTIDIYNYRIYMTVQWCKMKNANVRC